MHMKKVYSTLSILLICISSNNYGQLPTVRIPNSTEETVFNSPQQKEENPSLRSLYQKGYQCEDGRIVYQFSKAPLNYKDVNGTWQTIDWNPELIDDTYFASKQNNPVKLKMDGSVELFDGNRSAFSVKTKSIFGLSSFALSELVMSNQNTITKSLTENISQRATFKHNGIKLDYIIDSSQDFSNGVITQQVYCESGWTLSFHKEMKEAISITNKNGEEMGILYPIICTDANGNFSTGNYSFEKNSDGYLVKLKLNVDWLNASSRNFPVVVDPLIVGPTALWTGGIMPSCVLPTYNVDSLLVTIPGQTTITGVFVSASYYADPFTTAIMAEGQMHFSTSCGQTPDLSVVLPTGGTPGTAYLLDFNYRAPLSCCMGSSCADRTFYVRMHLGRTAGPVGCGTTYIYYDPFTAYPFSVYVEGKTAETNAISWTISPSPICSDECEVTMKTYATLGVPPYTVTHPWTTDSVVMGTPIFTCAIPVVNANLILTRPNCPVFCDTTTSVVVPLPTVRDACGNIVSGYVPKNLTIKPTPQITLASDSIVLCGNDLFNYTFDVCPSGTTVNWSTGSFSGTNTIDTNYNNTSANTIHTVYVANSSLNGCSADQEILNVYSSPIPIANADHPLAGLVSEPITFTDMSNYWNSSGSSWYWTFGDGGTGTDSSMTHSYAAEGTYNVCLYIESEWGCRDTICDTLKIIPFELILPNIITTNNDGVNDVLYFDYLPYYGVSKLNVFNRWGEVVYKSNDYKNDWAPTNLTDGTYFYVIEVPNKEPYRSTLNVFND